MSSKMLEALRPEDADAAAGAEDACEAPGDAEQVAGSAGDSPPGASAERNATVASDAAPSEAERSAADAPPCSGAPSADVARLTAWSEEPVAVGYACSDCPGAGAVRHPVLGPICSRCRLVLCAITDA